MGESVAEKESVESSEFARQYSREGHDVLRDYAEDYAADPLLASIMAAGEQAGQQPLTYTPELKASMKADAFADLARRDAFRQSSQSQIFDQLGLGRSEAGGVGLANQLRMHGLSDRMKAATQVEMQAAAQNQQDMFNAAMADLGLIQAQHAPLQEQAAALLGAFNQLGPAISATGSHSGPIDFSGGLSSAIGGFLGQPVPGTGSTAALTGSGGTILPGAAGGKIIGTPIAAGTGAAAGGSGAAILCWVAMALYGDDDPRTHWARHYILTSRHPAVRALKWLYQRVGRTVAALVKRSPLTRRILTPLFNVAWRRGMEA